MLKYFIQQIFLDISAKALSIKSFNQMLQRGVEQTLSMFVYNIPIHSTSIF